MLDVGSGPGHVAARAAARGGSIVGVDVAQEFARVLRGQGLEDIEVRTISFSHHEPSPDALWRGLLGGTVRASELIIGQTGDMKRTMRAAFDRIVQQYRVGDRLEVPVSAKLASGRKPAAPRT